MQTISRTTKLKDVLKLGSVCPNNLEKCTMCCAYNSGIVLNDELRKIASFLNISKDELREKYLKEHYIFNTKAYRINTKNKENKPYGSCLFFETEKNSTQSCMIHEVKPLHCTLANCNEHGEALHQWFVLNYLVKTDDPDSLRAWHAYAESTDVIDGGKLTDIIPEKKQREEIINNRVPGKDQQEMKKLSDKLMANAKDVEAGLEKRYADFIQKCKEKGIDKKIRIVEEDFEDAGLDEDTKKEILEKQDAKLRKK